MHEIGGHITLDARGVREVMTLTSTLRRAHDKASQAFPVLYYGEAGGTRLVKHHEMDIFIHARYVSGS